MASAGSRPARWWLTRRWLTRRWLTRAWRTCVLAAVATSVAGCVGMPNSGSPGTFSATPQDTSQDSDFIGAVPAGPQSGWGPADIVTGFLNATVSYPAYATITEQYLASSVPRTWAPNWSVTVVNQVIVNRDAAISAGGKRATVDVSGAVQASFNGTGQYVGAQQGSHGTQIAEEKFTLVKQGKQWRITNPPQNRMLTEPDFTQVYKPQDLYFYDPTGQVLVPDAVSVPRHQMAAQLVWTLTGQPGKPGGPPGIQAVQIEFNGNPWTPGTSPCPGTSGQSPTLKQAMYECKNPYPSSAPSTFYYVANEQAWFRCASETQVTAGAVGAVMPAFSRTGAVMQNHGCTSIVQAKPAAVLPAQPRTLPPLSMAAVSPDGKYLAGVGPGGNTVTVWAAGATKPYGTLPLSGVTAISWDRRDYLWAAHGNTTTMILQTSTNNHAAITNYFPQNSKILGLSIAPDGVRVAVIVGTSTGSEVELAAIDRGKPGPGQSANPLQRTSIGPPVQLGPNVANPIALTWYDADDLLVLDGAGDQTSLWLVPVDGQPATELPGVLPGAISITANGARNALVVGMTQNRMEVSAGPEGPWQPLGNGGQSPAFQAPAIPVPAQP